MTPSGGWRAAGVALAVGLGACGGDDTSAAGAGDAEVGATVESARRTAAPVVLAFWEADQPAFGVYVPDERPLEVRRSPEGRGQPPVYTTEGAAALAANPLYDFLFLNLEGAYDPAAVTTLSAAMAEAGGTPPALLVRIPPISADGEEAARGRVAEILAAGADGVVLPHIRNVEEARTAIAFFGESGADVWSPGNPDGNVVAMLMVEDPDAVADAEQIAALGGFSVLACGIGSLTRALDGDREAAEALNLDVLATAREAGFADMITAGTDDVTERVEQGFLALLMSGPEADEAIRIGREAAGR